MEVPNSPEVKKPRIFTNGKLHLPKSLQDLLIVNWPQIGYSCSESKLTQLSNGNNVVRSKVYWNSINTRYEFSSCAFEISILLLLSGLSFPISYFFPYFFFLISYVISFFQINLILIWQFKCEPVVSNFNYIKHFLDLLSYNQVINM